MAFKINITHYGELLNILPIVNGNIDTIIN